MGGMISDLSCRVDFVRGRYTRLVLGAQWRFVALGGLCWLYREEILLRILAFVEWWDGDGRMSVSWLLRLMKEPGMGNSGTLDVLHFLRLVSAIISSTPTVVSPCSCCSIQHLSNHPVFRRPGYIVLLAWHEYVYMRWGGSLCFEKVVHAWLFACVFGRGVGRMDCGNGRMRRYMDQEEDGWRCLCRWCLLHGWVVW